MTRSVLFPPIDLSPRPFLWQLCYEIDDQADYSFAALGDDAGVTFGIRERLELIGDPGVTFWDVVRLDSKPEVLVAAPLPFRQEQRVLLVAKRWLRSYRWGAHGLKHLARQADLLTDNVAFDPGLVLVSTLADEILWSAA
ncbi:hypothetical protein CL628_02940 [bacterium]|nr:hypothetical protein [bacterium]